MGAKTLFQNRRTIVLDHLKLNMTKAVECFEMATLDAGCCPWAIMASCSSTGLVKRGWKVTSRRGARGAGHSQLNRSPQCAQVGKEANSTWPASDRVSAGAGMGLFSCMHWW